MSKQHNLDPNQIIQNSYDAENNAQRVILISGEVPSYNTTGYVQTISPTVFETKEIRVPEIIHEVKIEYIEKPVYITQVEFKEIPVIVKEIEIKEIQIPVIIKELEIREIIKESPKPEAIIDNNKNHSELTQFTKVIMIIQSLTLFGLLVSNILKH